MYGVTWGPDPLPRCTQRGGKSKEGRGETRSQSFEVSNVVLQTLGFQSSDRTGIAAGSSIPIDLMRTLIDRMNLQDLTIAYGMSTSNYNFLHHFS